MFLLRIIIVAMIFSIQPFLKKKIMTEFTVDEYMIYTSLISLFIFFLTSIFKGLTLTNLNNKSIKSCGFLVLISILTLIYSYTLNLLLKDFNISNVMPRIRCAEMLFIFLISGYLNFNEISYNKMIGILLVIIGIYISK